jgi:hypothetical protein
VKAFPHLVEMHQKYGKEGLVIISLSLDLALAREEDDKASAEEIAKEVRAFLKKRNAAFGARIMDEPIKFLQEKLHFVAAPCAFVFDRKGQWTQFSGDRNEFDPERIEKFVVERLREK